MTTKRLVLVAIDFSPASHLALRWAHAYARATSQTLHLIHVVEDLPGLPATKLRIEQDERQLTESARHELTKLAPVDATETPFVYHVRRGHPVREIVTCARDLDAALLVVGSHGHAGLERVLLGSVAERLVRLAPCPVVVIKEDAQNMRR